MTKLGLFLAGAALAAAVSALSGCSDVQQHHVKVLKDYGGNVSFLDGPTWQYTGVTVTPVYCHVGPSRKETLPP